MRGPREPAVRARLTPVLALAAVVGALLLGPAAVPASATTPPACGATLLSAASWLRGAGGGVLVRANGADQGTGASCAGLSTKNRSVQDGYGWQCVELAARLYAVKGWGTVYADGGAAAGAYRYGAKYLPEGSPGLTFHANGTGYVPVPGDLVIETSSAYGHVAVVDTVVGSTIDAVEQNASATGRHTYTIHGSTITGAYPGSTVRGVLHAPANHATNAVAPTVVSAPHLSGSLRVGTVATCAVTYASASTVTYLWTDDRVRIAGATGRTYALRAADYRRQVACTTAARNRYGTTATSGSPARTVAAGSAPVDRSRPTVTGTVRAGATVTARPGAWSPTPRAFTFQWLRAGRAIAGAVHATYRPTRADVGRALSVRVTTVLTGYRAASGTSSAISVRR